jgi:hypothetical protein
MQSFFSNSNCNTNPPLTEEAIAIAEKELNVKLPVSFLNLLKVQNGGYTSGFVFPMKEPTSWAPDHVPLHELNGIVLNANLKTLHNILDTNYLAEEWGLPERQVILSGDGHCWITLDYRRSEVPTVRWIDAELDQDIHVAESFDEFLNGLISEDDFSRR